MFSKEGWRVPDKLFAIIAGAVMILTWGILGFFYRDLPAHIATHFNFAGYPDVYVPKSYSTVFFPAGLQLLLAGLLTMLYWQPRFYNWPSSSHLETIPEPAHRWMIKLIRHSLVMTILLTNLIFAAIALAVVTVSLGTIDRFNGWLIVFLVGWLVLENVVYLVWIHRLAQKKRILSQPAAN